MIQQHFIIEMLFLKIIIGYSLSDNNFFPHFLYEFISIISSLLT